MKTKPLPEYGGRPEQAARLGISISSFDRLAKHPLFPAPIRALESRPLYKNADVDVALRLISQEREAA